MNMPKSLYDQLGGFSAVRKLVSDFGVSETGSFYFVMELLSGIDLESMGGRISMPWAV